MDAAGIAAVAKGAGLTDPDKLATAVAIALAESGGNPSAHNAKPPDNSYGLWQINMLGAMGPSRRKQFGITSNEQLFDPAINARAMMIISSNGSNFRPWTTFTGGAFLRHIQDARASVGAKPAVTAVQTGFDATPAASSLDSLKTAVGALSAASAWLSDRHNWQRVGYVGLGVGMLFIAAGMVSAKPANALLGAVSKVKGKVAPI